MTKRAYKLGALNSELSIFGNEMILEVLNSYREALIKNRRMYYANQIRKSRLDLANVTAEFSFMPNISKYVIEASLNTWCSFDFCNTIFVTRCFSMPLLL
jgi:ATP-binding cassette, subfamily B, bacterial PglK